MRLRPVPSSLGLAALLAVVAAAAPARADLGASVQLGLQVPTQTGGRSAGGDVQTAVAASYDVVRPPVVPVRASIDLDYASGAHDAGKLDVFGIGAGARLTTPLYVGGSFGLYDVAAHADDPAQASHVAVGLGSDLFAGTRLLALPGGVNLALQLDYRAAPSAGGVNGGAIGAGLRLHF